MNIFMESRKNSNSSIIAQALAENYGHCLMLTNSFYGVQKDIEDIADVYQAAFLFKTNKILLMVNQGMLSAFNNKGLIRLYPIFNT